MIASDIPQDLWRIQRSQLLPNVVHNGVHVCKAAWSTKTCRYLKIHVKTADDPVDGLRAWFTAYPFKESERFKSNDASLNPIWDIGWRTVQLCARDTYMETPCWERLQYTGDTRIQLPISYVVSGDDRLGRQVSEAFHNVTVSEGVAVSHHPASTFQSIPSRAADLKRASFFDVAQLPTATLVSKSFARSGSGLTVSSDLTLCGIS